MVHLDCLPVVNHQTVVIKSQKQGVRVLGHSHDVGIENKFFVERKHLMLESVGEQMVVDGYEKLVML
jgi:hypothetical protein